MAGKLGRLPAHDPYVRPRLQLRHFLTAAAYPAPPAVVDYVSAVNAWPMYLNDKLGCCTISAQGHMEEAATQYGQGATVRVSDADILTAYEAVSGYRPGHPETDQGAVMQDALDYWRKVGLGGHKILAFAEVDVHNPAELKAALWMFGHVYVGINCPDSALRQFDAGQPWDVVPGARIDGGHAIDLGYAADGENFRVITWGAGQEMTLAFLAKYGEEAWVAATPEWVNAKGMSPEGLDVAALNSAFTSMTGDAGPFPVQPTPDPGPVPVGPPAPVADPDDLQLVAAQDEWRRRKGLS